VGLRRRESSPDAEATFTRASCTLGNQWLLFSDGPPFSHERRPDSFKCPKLPGPVAVCFGSEHSRLGIVSLGGARIVEHRRVSARACRDANTTYLYKRTPKATTTRRVTARQPHVMRRGTSHDAAHLVAASSPPATTGHSTAHQVAARTDRMVISPTWSQTLRPPRHSVQSIRRPTGSWTRRNPSNWWPRGSAGLPTHRSRTHAKIRASNTASTLVRSGVRPHRLFPAPTVDGWAPFTSFGRV